MGLTKQRLEQEESAAHPSTTVLQANIVSLKLKTMATVVKISIYLATSHESTPLLLFYT
jgi:hypothetical protein